MSSPKKKKKQKKDPSQPEAPAGKTLSPKSKLASILSIAPHHPIWAQLNDPENDGVVWLVEYVNPPGVFMARAIPDSVDMDAVYDDVSASFKALKSADSTRSRYTLGMGYCGAHARRLVEAIARDHAKRKLPFSAADVHDIWMTFRVVQ